MLHEILSGASASEVFRSYLQSNPTHSNKEVALEFLKSAPSVDTKTVQLIWNWNSPCHPYGFDDDALNRGITEFLIEAGYLTIEK